MSPELRELIDKGKTTACCDHLIESLLWQLATHLERFVLMADTSDSENESEDSDHDR